MRLIAKGIAITAPGLPTTAKITGYERSADQTEAREIKDLSKMEMVKNYEPGETTPGQYTINFENVEEPGDSAATTPIIIGTQGYLRVFKALGTDDSPTWTLERKVPVILIEGPSSSAQDKQIRTGTVKYQIRKKFTTNEASALTDAGSDTYTPPVEGSAPVTPPPVGASKVASPSGLSSK